MSKINSFIPIIIQNFRSVLLSIAMFGMAIACGTSSSESENDRASSLQSNVRSAGKERVDRRRNYDEEENRREENRREENRREEKERSENLKLDDDEFDEDELDKSKKYNSQDLGNQEVVENVNEDDEDEDEDVMDIERREAGVEPTSTSTSTSTSTPQGESSPSISTPKSVEMEPESTKTTLGEEEEELVPEEEMPSTAKPSDEADKNEVDESGPNDKEFMIEGNCCGLFKRFGKALLRPFCIRNWKYKLCHKICEIPKDYEVSLIGDTRTKCCSELVMMNTKLSNASEEGPREVQQLAKILGVSGNTFSNCEMKRIGIETRRMGFRPFKWLYPWRLFGIGCKGRNMCRGKEDTCATDRFAIVSFNRSNEFKNFFKTLSVRWYDKNLTDLNCLKDMDDPCNGEPSVDLRMVAFTTYVYDFEQDKKDNCNEYEYYIDDSSRRLLCDLLKCSKKIKYTYKDPVCCKDVNFTVHKTVLRKGWYCGSHYLKNCCSWIKRKTNLLRKKDCMIFLFKDKGSKVFKTCYEAGCFPCDKPCKTECTTQSCEPCDPCPPCPPCQPCDPCKMTFRDIKCLRGEGKNAKTRLWGLYNRRGRSSHRKVMMIKRNCKTGDCSVQCLAIVEIVWEFSGKDKEGKMVKYRTVVQ